MKAQLPRSFKQDFSKEINGYEFTVGILEDKPHFWPKGVRGVKSGKAGPASNLKNYAGGPARLTSRKKDGESIGQVLVDNMKRQNRNFLKEPFEKPNARLIKFLKAFLDMALAKKSPKRVENLLQAVVRNPILEQKYGRNKAKTARAKGFNRLLIDTAQMFRAIKATVTRVRK